MIRIGYACINTRLPSPNRTCRLKNATAEKILELSSANLSALERILEWNAETGIQLFRITSDVIPFGSHAVNKLPWRRLLRSQCERLGHLIRQNSMRVSMHPGQFTVLNSPRRDVVASSIQELDYHTDFLDALGIPESHKIVVHLGGVYGDKARSLDRFIQTYKALGPRVRSRLVIENDEHCYSLADALKVAQAVSVPVVFDVFHHRWNPSLPQHPLRSLVELAARTWRRRDGRPKIHYSNQWPGKAPGTHSKTIRLKRFEEFYEQIEDFDLDIMLEVKDKERSVLKVMRALGGTNRGETGTRPNHLQSKNHDHTNAPVAQAH